MPNLSELLYYTGETSTQLIVWSLFIGVAIAAIAGYLIKAKFGVFIRKLLENEIDSPEKAVTLEELGLQKKFFIKFGLRSHANYKNMLVAITEDGKFFANNTYTDIAPLFKEFIVVKRKRTRDVIKESENNRSEESAPLSGLAKVIRSKEKTASSETEHNKETATTIISEGLNTEKDANNSEKNTDQFNIDTKPTPERTPTEESSAHATTEEDTSQPNSKENIAQTTGTRYSDIPKERVKFDVAKARYYIPAEIHDRAYSLYHAKSGRSNAFIQIIILLVVLALVATVSGSLVSGFTDFVGGIKNPFEKPII